MSRPRLTSLMNKRALGYLRWLRRRAGRHDPRQVAALIADLHEQRCDHVVCTGDLCNLGLPEEWALARAFLESLGSPGTASFVPGNHDAYVPGALEGLLAQCGAWIGDGSSNAFPYLRRVGPLALIGLSSAVPTGLHRAIGRLGERQIAATEAMLNALALEADPPCRAILIHHPPYPGGASKDRALLDAGDFTAMIARAGAELILHGHNHVSMMAFLDGPGGVGVPTVAVASATATSMRPFFRAAYQLFDIARSGDSYAITAVERGLRADGSVGELYPINLTRHADPALDRISLPVFEVGATFGKTTAGEVRPSVRKAARTRP